MEPSHVIMSLLYQRLSFTLKWPRTIVRKGLYESWFNSKLLMSDSKSTLDWLDEWYKTEWSYIAYFSFTINEFLQVMDIFNFKWKRDVVVNTPCLTFKGWCSLYRL